MRTVKEALQLVSDRVRPLIPVESTISDAMGAIVAEDVVSSLDSPPFDKALMDGFAVRAADISGDSTSLSCVEVLTAGQVARQSVESGTTIQIMTGCPMPRGADSVVPVERTTVLNGEHSEGTPRGSEHSSGPEERSKTSEDTDAAAPVEPTSTVGAQIQFQMTSVPHGANVLTRGECMRTGETVLTRGSRLGAEALGLLAELGEVRTSIQPRPRVAILATGDELVEPGEDLGPGQIRNSNESMLAAQVRRAGAIPVPLGIARDNRDELRQKIRAGLEADMLILSGGVSAGILDLVPSELAEAGVSEVFHKVKLKPGKPIWFGVRDGDGPQCVVFGLPGNPVSSLVCFELFVRTALRKLQAAPALGPFSLEARLTQEHIARGGRPTYYPCRLHWDTTGARATPCPWRGSADLRATASANAMMVLGEDPMTHASGDPISVIPWEFEPQNDSGGRP